MSKQWIELFAEFEERLNEWLTRAAEPPSISPPRSPESAVLRPLGERLERLQTYLDKAEHDAEQALAPLTADIQALQHWLDALKTVRTNLDQRAVRASSA